MDKNSFSELTESLTEGLEIVKGNIKPSRTFTFEPVQIKSIRERTGASQEAFAAMLNISPKTLKNWEQGQRTPTGPARVLLKLVEKNPKGIVKLLQGN
ncbi:MAG: NadS family protein [Desulfobacteraceae bacterium]|jgi:putative transcriptional regulator